MISFQVVNVRRQIDGVKGTWDLLLPEAPNATPLSSDHSCFFLDKHNNPSTSRTAVVTMDTQAGVLGAEDQEHGRERLLRRR